MALGWTVYADLMVGELAVSWSAHAALLLLPFLAWQAAAREARRAAVSGLAIFGGLMPWGAQLFEDRAPPLPEGAPALRFMVANTFYDPPRLEALTRDLEAARPDVVALVEPPSALPPHLAATGRWRVLAAHLPGDKNNIALVVRAAALAPEGPLEVVRVEAAARAYTPSVPIEAVLRWEGLEVQVVAAHPPAPTERAQHSERLRLVPELAARLGAPGVLLADLNATRASPLWGMLVQSGLRRPEGAAPGTWPSWFAGLGLAIDHVLVTEGFVAAPAAPVWLSGSDHRGVIVDVRPSQAFKKR